MFSVRCATSILKKCCLPKAQYLGLRFETTASSASLPIEDYKFHKLEWSPPKEVECTREDALNYLRLLKQIRRLETAAGNLYKEKHIRGFCHLYSGQEAIAVGLDAAMQPGDLLITAYRAHGIVFTRGATIRSVLAELAGRVTGCSGGLGGSMHMYHKDFFGGNGIVGAQCPLGVGLALRIKHRDEKAVSVTMYGDGAANQGQLFEAFNIAKLWNLPVVFVCENNKYGMGTAAHRASANTAYYTRGDYIPGLWVDGMDVLTVREAMRFAREWCVTGKGPILLEMETYRYHGHSMSDPGTSYRTRDEVQAMRRGRDPITLFEKRLIEAALITDEEAKAMEKKIRQEVEKDAEECLNDPGPSLESRFLSPCETNPPGYKIRGCDPLTWGTPK